VDHDDDGNKWLADLWCKFQQQAVGKNASLPFPWPTLSRLSGGLRAGKVHLLAGPQGTGKTFFILLCAMAIHGTGKPWKYLPLEDSKQDYLVRLLAMLTQTYRMIDEDVDGAIARSDAVEAHRDSLLDLQGHICPNPREDAGQLKFDQTDALAWFEGNMRDNRVLILDPITQIEFDAQYKSSLRVEEGFIRDLLGLAAKSKTSFIVVTHTKNRAGAKGKLPITIEDIQGSSLWAKLCQQVILLDSHEEKDSRVHCKPIAPGAPDQRVITHNRTVLIGKTRFGKGTKRQIAFSQDGDQPQFTEHGVLVPKGK